AAPEGEATGVAIDGAGRAHVLIGLDDGTVQLWSADPNTAELSPVAEGALPGVALAGGLVSTPLGFHLAAGTRDGRAIVVQCVPDQQTCVQAWTAPAASAGEAVVPLGASLIVAGQDATQGPTLWRVGQADTTAQALPADGQSGRARSVVVDGDGTVWAAGSIGDAAAVWRVDEDGPSAPLRLEQVLGFAVADVGRLALDAAGNVWLGIELAGEEPADPRQIAVARIGDALDGVCAPDAEVCDGRDQDCDLRLDEAAPGEASICGEGQVCSASACQPACAVGTACDATCRRLDVDPMHCGACAADCDSTWSRAACGGGRCAVLDCLAGFADANGHPDDGCECALAGDEVCNQRDDDCDGAVDEGFDLALDRANCGACRSACAADEVCAAGCSSGPCPAGEVRVDETCQAPARTLRVGGGEAYESIGAALADAQAGDRIEVLAGAYAEALEVTVPSLTIEAAEGAAVQVQSPDDRATLNVTADDVVVRGLAITAGDGAVVAVFLDGARGALVDSEVVGPTTGVPGQTAGVQVGGDGVVVAANTVS
ncbi:MAG: hypothetical protein KC583_02960, partial [Myxococcales bacterium]|nr:hypothetical protein [Myxococcales bacterium]